MHERVLMSNECKKFPPNTRESTGVNCETSLISQPEAKLDNVGYYHCVDPTAWDYHGVPFAQFYFIHLVHQVSEPDVVLQLSSGPALIGSQISWCWTNEIEDLCELDQ